MIDAFEVLKYAKSEDEESEEKSAKKKGLSPFDIVKNINRKDGVIDNDEIQENYVPYVINRVMSGAVDTVLLANEMNSFPSLDKWMQYHFYYFGVDRHPKRFIEWMKAEHQNAEALKLICEVYGYSRAKANDVLPILRDKLGVLFDLKGGKKNEKSKHS